MLEQYLGSRLKQQTFALHGIFTESQKGRHWPAGRLEAGVSVVRESGGQGQGFLRYHGFKAWTREVRVGIRR